MTKIRTPKRSPNTQEVIARLKSEAAENIAFFTGAGASTAFGYPLTADLLPRMFEWINDPDFLAIEHEPSSLGERRRRDLKVLFRRLLPGHRNGNPLPLVTTLLSVLDHGIAHRQPLWPGRSVKGLRSLRTLLDHGICDAIGEHESYGEKEEKTLRRYGRLLAELASRGRRVGVITTNYDTSSDWAVLHAAHPRAKWGNWDEHEAGTIDFGTDWLFPYSGDKELPMTRPANSKFACYKLHGSTNWLRCPACQRIYINTYGPVWFQAFRHERDDANSCHCSRTKLEPQIVSPSYVRNMDDLNLLNVWNQAQGLLRRADHWVIVGYSLPEEDVAIRALFTRALNYKEKPPHVTVVQLGDGGREKFEILFGRKNIDYVTGGFAAFLQP